MSEPTLSSEPASTTKQPSLLEQVGGIRGLADGALPVIAFTSLYALNGQNLKGAVLAALGVSLVLAVINVIQKAPLSYVVSGAIGVAIAAFVAQKTGKAENFFLPGILFNGVYALICFGSIALKKPILGYIVKALGMLEPDWKTNPKRWVAVKRATAVWGGVYFLRLAVQLPLYLAGEVVLLGTARVVMGIPLSAVGVWLTWLLLRKKGEEEAPTSTIQSR